MMKVKIVKALSANSLEVKINAVLEEYNNEIFDIKITATVNGNSETLYAVIMFKN